MKHFDDCGRLMLVYLILAILFPGVMVEVDVPALCVQAASGRATVEFALLLQDEVDCSEIFETARTLLRWGLLPLVARSVFVLGSRRLHDCVL